MGETATSASQPDPTQAALASWLKKDPSSPTELADWLSGFRLPLTAAGDEPYLRILHALPLGRERHRLETELGRRLATFVDQRFDIVMPQEVRHELVPKLLYNALLLAAGLARSDELGASLFAIFSDTRTNLQSEWMGYKLSWALGEALIKNQFDNKMADTWLKMAAGQPTPPIEGTPEDGVRGAMFMPPSKDRRGEPALDVIAEALRSYGDGVSTRTDGRMLFRALLDQFYALHGRSRTRELIDAADRANWTLWMVDCVGLKDQIGSKGGFTAVTTSYRLAGLVPKYAIKRRLCQDAIIEVQFSGRARALVNPFLTIANAFEEARAGNYYYSDRSMNSAYMYALCVAEERSPEHAKLFAREHRKILNI